MVSKNFDRYVIVCHGMPGKGATVPMVVEVWSLKKSHGDEISTATKCQCTRNLPHCRPSNACSSKLLQWFWSWETQLDNSLGEANYKKRRTFTEWKPQLFQCFVTAPSSIRYFGVLPNTDNSGFFWRFTLQVLATTIEDTCLNNPRHLTFWSSFWMITKHMTMASFTAIGEAIGDPSPKPP